MTEARKLLNLVEGDKQSRDLLQFGAHINHNLKREADRIFPDKPKGHTKAAKMVASYCICIAMWLSRPADYDPDKRLPYMLNDQGAPHNKQTDFKAYWDEAYDLYWGMPDYAREWINTHVGTPKSYKNRGDDTFTRSLPV